MNDDKLKSLEIKARQALPPSGELAKGVFRGSFVPAVCLDLVTELQQAQAREAWYLAKLEAEAMPQEMEDENRRPVLRTLTAKEWREAAEEALAQQPQPRRTAGAKIRRLQIRIRQAGEEADWLARQLAAQAGHSVVYWRTKAFRAAGGGNEHADKDF